MRITAFGANGQIGSRFVRLATEAGHEVTAFIHGYNPFEDLKNVTVVAGDIYDPVSVESAVEGSDVVVSALGSWGTKRKDILSVGMEHIVPAMEKLGVERIVTLTGSSAHVEGEQIPFVEKIARFGIGIIAPKIVQDGELHIKRLRQSELAWTVLRSPIMQDAGEPGDYVLDTRFPGPIETIGRDQVAAALLHLVESGEFTHAAPMIHRK